MAKSVYLISEAAKEVCVENHVLRYWEEELALPVKRNSQGHRYYTMEDLNTFKRIKYLKEQGLQLKAIKLFLSKDGRLISYRSKEEVTEDAGQKKVMEEKNEKSSLAIRQGDKVTAFCKETSQRNVPERDPAHTGAPGEEKSVKLLIDGEGSLSAPQCGKEAEQARREERNEKARKLQMILKIMIEEVLREYDSDLKEGLKEEISERLCTDVRDAVVKEMDYQFRMQEEREDKRGQDREERDRELLERIDGILQAKKAGKTAKTVRSEKALKPWKTEKTVKAEISDKTGITETPEKAEKTDESEKAERPGKTEKGRQKKAGIFSWKAKSFLS